MIKKTMLLVSMLTLVSCNTGHVTSTPVPTDTPIPTLMPLTAAVVPSTKNALPTLSPPEARAKVMDLLETNGGCDLPCWWGIDPGVTTDEEALRFVSSFATRLEITEKELRVGPDKKEHFYRSYDVYLELDGVESGFEIFIQDGMVYGFQLGSYLTGFKYKLHQLLEKHGKPTKVFVKTFSNTPDDYIPFRIIVFYEDYSAVAAYSAESGATLRDNVLVGCLGSNGPALILFDKHVVFSDKKIQEMILGPEPRGVLPAEVALGMTMEQFYETFRDPDASCLETPVDLWQ